MKRKSHLSLLLLPVASVILNSCGPATETHNVRIYEYRRQAPAKKTPAPSDDPRDFKPKEVF